MSAHPENTHSQRLWGIFLALAVMATLFQHAFTCATQGKWGFLALGVLITPVGILNGLGLWLGLW
jgi:hypothetical protein